MNGVFNIPAGFWLAPMEPDKAMWEKTYGNNPIDHYKQMRDSWINRHPAPPVDAVPGEPVAEGWTQQSLSEALQDFLRIDAHLPKPRLVPHERMLVEHAIDALAASVAPRAGSEPVMWQSRFFDSTSSVTPGWGKWEEVVPRNPYTDTVEDRVQELRHYIASGYKYELRALYAAAPAASLYVRESELRRFQTQASELTVEWSLPVSKRPEGRLPLYVIAPGEAQS